VLDRNPITAKLRQIEGGEILIVVDQEDPSLPRHTSDIRRASLRRTLRRVAELVATALNQAAGRMRFFAVR
jgi:hypothetical protein